MCQSCGKMAEIPSPVSSERDAGSSRAQCLMGGPEGCRPEWRLGSLQDHQGARLGRGEQGAAQHRQLASLGQVSSALIPTNN